MRACVQRVLEAEVRIDDEVSGRIGPGLVVLLGVAAEDTETEARWLAEKIAGLRIFADENGLMNRSVDQCAPAAHMQQSTQFVLGSRGAE